MGRGSTCIGAAFHLCPGCAPSDSALEPGLFISDSVGLFVAVGNSAKQGALSDSISGQISALTGFSADLFFRSYVYFSSSSSSLSLSFFSLSHIALPVFGYPMTLCSLLVPLFFLGFFEDARRQLQAANNNPSNITDRSVFTFAAVLTGALPLVVDADQSDIIASLARLQSRYGFRLVIRGGAEAHVVRAQLASASPPISVLLQARAPPSTFNTHRARWDAATLLRAAGVPVGLYIADVDSARNMRFEAGIAMTYGLSFEDALRAVTSSVAGMFGPATSGLTADAGTASFGSTLGQLAVGGRANFVAFDDDPFSLRSHVQLVALGSHVHCQPIQF